MERLCDEAKATCKAQEVNPREYLNDIIEKMPRMKDATQEELVGLLPHKWKMVTLAPMR